MESVMKWTEIPQKLSELEKAVSHINDLMPTLWNLNYFILGGSIFAALTIITFSYLFFQNRKLKLRIAVIERPPSGQVSCELTAPTGKSEEERDVINKLEEKIESLESKVEDMGRNVRRDISDDFNVETMTCCHCGRTVLKKANSCECGNNPQESKGRAKRRKAHQ